MSSTEMDDEAVFVSRELWREEFDNGQDDRYHNIYNPPSEWNRKQVYNAGWNQAEKDLSES